MKSKIVSGLIVYRDNLEIEYGICRVDQTIFENEEFRYDFYPNYDVIDLLPPEFDGIPGLDLSLRKDCYTRENVLPVFISERVVPENRENLNDELSKVGLPYYDALGWLLLTDTRYFGDRLFVKKNDDTESGSFDAGNNLASAYSQCGDLMEAIGRGRKIILAGRQLNLDETRIVADLMRTIIANDHGKRRIRNPVGRKPADVDPSDLEKICMSIARGNITAEEGAESLGISRATLYRRMNQFGISLRTKKNQ